MDSVLREQNNDYLIYVTEQIRNHSKYLRTRMQPAIYAYYKRYMLNTYRYLLDAILSEDTESDPSPYYMCRMIESAFKVDMENYSLISRLLGKYKQELEGRRLAVAHCLDIVLSYRKYKGYYPNADYDHLLLEKVRRIIENDYDYNLNKNKVFNKRRKNETNNKIF